MVLTLSDETQVQIEKLLALCGDCTLGELLDAVVFYQSADDLMSLLAQGGKPRVRGKRVRLLKRRTLEVELSDQVSVRIEKMMELADTTGDVIIAAILSSASGEEIMEQLNVGQTRRVRRERVRLVIAPGVIEAIKAKGIKVWNN